MFEKPRRAQVVGIRINGELQWCHRVGAGHWAVPLAGAALAFRKDVHFTCDQRSIHARGCCRPDEAARLNDCDVAGGAHADTRAIGDGGGLSRTRRRLHLEQTCANADDLAADFLRGLRTRVDGRKP